MPRHKFEANRFIKLESPERKKALPIEEILTPLNDLNREIKVADIGCGIGYLSLPLAEKLVNSGEVYAIDISSEMLEVLRGRIGQLTNIRVIQSEENYIPIADDLIDLSFLMTVFHELNDPEQYIPEIKRISKPEHRVIIIDWTKTARSYGPPLSRAIAKEEVIRIFKEHDYQLEKSYLDGQTVYGLVFVKK